MKTLVTSKEKRDSDTRIIDRETGDTEEGGNPKGCR